MTYGLQIDKKKGHVRIRLPNAIKKGNILQIKNRIEDGLTDCKGKVILDFADTLSVFNILVTLIMHIRKRVGEFGIFRNDCSSIRIGGQLISLNLEATK